MRNPRVPSLMIQRDEFGEWSYWVEWHPLFSAETVWRCVTWVGIAALIYVVMFVPIL